MNTIKKRSMSKTVKNLLIDVALFIVFMLSMNPHFTGAAVHEWLGLALGSTIFVHLLLHWQWLAAITRRFFQRVPGRDRINYILNALLFVAFTLIVTSGLFISESIAGMVGLHFEPGMFWRGLHETAANLSIFLVALHLAFNWKWITNAAKKYVWQPLTRARGNGRIAKGATL